jgi:ADP-heptose:LPS heptosyltransferase
VTNDTGGMHLANALGAPLVALFGPTNPVRTGPVFAAPFEILQPPDCPPTGGGSLANLSPETVLVAVSHHLTSDLRNPTSVS